MKNRVLAVGALVSLFAVTACGGHSGTPSTTSALPPFTGSPALSNFTWGKEQLQGAIALGPASVGHMQVNVMVKAQNARGLVSYAQMASTPGSPLYRHFLTPQEIGQRFGATQTDYQAAADYFVRNGLHVAGWPQRLMLAVAGSQDAMEKAFGTQFGLYEKDGFQFIAPLRTPHFATLVPVTAVQNLVALNTMHTYLVKPPPRANASDNIGYSPQAVRKAFDFTGAYAKGFDGSGITVGIIGTGPINVGDRSNLCSDADLNALKALYNANAATVCEVDVTPTGVSAGLAASGIPTAAPASPNPVSTPVSNPGVPPTSMFPFSGDFQTPPPVTAPCSAAVPNVLPTCNPEDGEAQLDTQQVALLAPGSSVKFYLAYNASDCYVFFPNPCAPAPTPPATPIKGGNYGQPQIGLIEGDAEIQQAIADNNADVLSVSYGGGEPQQVGGWYDSSGAGFGPTEFAALAAEGIAVFVSSGDNGSAECSSATTGYQAKQCVSYPSGDVNVTSVGGVNAPINEFGQLYATMTAWGTTSSSGTSGSGGGVSTIFTAPPWQQTALNATMRAQPDVALIGDPFTGVTMYENAGFLAGDASDVGGTSVAAPQMAAMWALVLQACKATAACGAGPSSHPYRLGNAAPLLYRIYKTGSAGSPPTALPYSQVFYDIVYGSNAMLNPVGSATPVPGQLAGPGYDQTTGVGVPFAGHLIQAVTGVTVP
jgi:subtilase family serine protease